MKICFYIALLFTSSKIFARAFYEHCARNNTANLVGKVLTTNYTCIQITALIGADLTTYDLIRKSRLKTGSNSLDIPLSLLAGMYIANSITENQNSIIRFS